MHREARWQRATLLFQQRRHDLVVSELRALLTEEPDDAPAHALLALTLLHLDQLDEALREAQQAIASDPESDFAHGALASVLLAKRDHDGALAAARRAIELDPDDVHHRATLAQACYAARRFDEALAAADDGLTIDPHDVDCLNLRSAALTKLGRSDEANDAGEAALAKDPDNPWTRHTRGYALLNQGDAKGALHHFQEALRRDPSMDGARAGLVEALKARNPFYRVVLGWFLWLDRFSQGKQRQILIGAWLIATMSSRGLRSAGHEDAATVVSLSWLAVVFVTALTVPMFNLLLLLHPIGRHALDRQSRRDALLLGSTMLVTIGVCLHAWLGDALWSKTAWPFWVVYLLPVAGIGAFWSGWGRHVVQWFCLALLGAWSWWLVRLWSLENGLDGGAAAIEALRAHLRLDAFLLLAAAFSTWFVMLAPKGHPPRRRS